MTRQNLQLCIDIGNTRIKSGLFDRDELVEQKVFDSLETAIDHWNRESFDACIISSVRSSLDDLKSSISFDFIFLDRFTPIPIKNEYQAKSTLGLDRLAAAIGAWSLAEGDHALAIDLGTCITFDHVSSGSYLGGAISPGMRLRFKSMNSLTANLPLIELDNAPDFKVGKTTEECMKTGVWSGISYEILGQIDDYSQEFPEMQTFMTGGDAHFFESLAKDHIFVVPNLVLTGLNCILNHNVE